ncbi:MAG: cupin-like domain-containing protein [Pacificimonas sp.]
MPSAELALKRRDWLLATMERQRRLSAFAGNVPVQASLTGEQFLTHFYAPGRPVLMQKIAADWTATNWTPEGLAERVGSAPVEVQGGRESDPDFETRKDDHRQTMPFDAFIDAIGVGGNDLYMTAYNSAANRKVLAVLDTDLGTIDAVLTDAPGMMWIGPGGTFTPLHFDLTNNLIVQLVGRKTIVLIPPAETAKLGHEDAVFSTVGDIEDEAALARQPGAIDAHRFTLELGPGDALFVPIGWWHQVRAAEFSVTMTYTNFRWPNRGHEDYPG